MKRFYNYFSLFVCLMFACNSFAGSPTSLTSISILPNPQAIYCAGSGIDVFFIVDDDANPGNVFTVQLSDASGSFANPVNIGSVASTTSSSLVATIPVGTIAGTGYRIRIVSSSPVVTSADNANDIIISQLPSVTIEGVGSPVGPPGGFCPGTGIFLTANVVGTASSYQWKLNGNNINGAVQSDYFGTVAGDYSVIVTSNGGCSAESAIFQAFELSNPQGEITGNNMLCPGGSVFLNANSITGTWYLNGSEIPDNFSSLLIATVPGGYQWLPHTISGCSGTLSPIFTVTTLSSSFTGLANNYTVSAAPATLVGNPGGGTFSGPGVSGNTFNPAAAGVGGPYTITYTYTSFNDPNQPDGCTVTSTQVTSVTQGCIPPPAVITAGGETTFCSGNTVELEANSGTGLTYQWKRNGLPIGGATLPFYTASGSGSYSVVVTNADGCSMESNTIQVTVTQPPVGSITGGESGILCPTTGTLLLGNTFDGFWYLNGVQIPGALGNTYLATVPGNYQFFPLVIGDFCQGVLSPIRTLTLLTTSFTGLAGSYASTDSPVTLVGTPAGGTFSGPGVSGNQFDPAAAGVGGPYTITYTYTDQSAFCTVISSQQTNVTQGGCIPPAATITAAGPVIFCEGGTVLLNANTGTGFSYQWQVDGANITGSVGSSFVATNSGNYTVVVTNADGCSATSAPVTVTVNARPVATITPNGPTTFCTNGSVTLTANTGAGFSYQWQTGTVNISGATSSSFVASLSGSYTVVITNANGCTDTSSAIAVTSNALPPVSFSGLANLYPVNAPAVTLTGDPAGGTFSGPGISGNTFNPAVAGAGGPYTIVYTYTNANGCTNTSTHQTNVGTICPVPSIPGSISTTSDGTSVCPGDERTYNIPAVPGATSYTWTAPPGASITGGQGTVSATVTYDAGFTTGDSLRVTANNSCGSSIPRARKINRHAPPSSPTAILGPITGVCNTTGITYSVSPIPGNTFNWSWNTAAASINSGQGTETITSDFTTAFITGKISVTTSNACGTSSPRNLNVDAKPGAAAAIAGIAGVCANQQAVAYSISPVVNATSYIWYAPTGAHINDGVTTSAGSSIATNAINVQVNYGTTGGLVRVKAVNACTVGTVTSLPVSIVCREGLLPASDIATAQAGDIYPNPSNGQFRIMLGNVQNTASVKIEIMNQFGQRVYQGIQSCSNGMMNIDLKDKFANGIYMVSCVVNGEKLVRKLMISK